MKPADTLPVTPWHKSIVFWLSLIIFSAMAAVYFEIIRAQVGAPLQNIYEVLGTVIGLIFWPLGFARVIAGIVKVIGLPLSSAGQLQLIIALWMVWVFCQASIIKFDALPFG